MSSNNNDSSVLVESKQALISVKGQQIETIEEGQNNAENSKSSRLQANGTKKEGGVQTRHLKEAGVSTNSDRIVLRSGKPQDQSAPNSCQTNKFKPANHGAEPQNATNEVEQVQEAETGIETSLGGGDKQVGLGKSRSLGSTNTQTRSRCLKTSGREVMDVTSGKRSVTSPDQLMAEDEMLVNNGTNSSASLTASTGEEQAKKLRSDDKSNQKLSHLKNKDEQSADESSSKSGGASKASGKDKKLNLKHKEKSCLTWMKEVKTLEGQSNIEISQEHNEDDMPKYCSNKICPISEDKIPKVPKVQNMAKKVTLRKVVFEEHDERWYCIKCLKAHNESLFCFYCGQIYFVGSNDFEDDGKPWILCDDCDKWIHLDCDILKGKNLELKKHYNDQNFHYSCPCCRGNTKVRRRSAKDLRKRKPSFKGEPNQTYKRKCIDNNSSVYSNSVENEAPNYKTSEYRSTTNAKNGHSQVDEEMVDDSYYSHTENGKRMSSEVEAEGMVQNGHDSRKMEFKKRKQMKKSRSNLHKSKKIIKTQSEDHYSNDYQNYKESIEEFTRERSMKIAKERMDIVESRTLCMNVSKFCGLTESILQDRIQQDLDNITNAITANERSESDNFSNSPQKESERDNRSCRGGMSARNSTSAMRMNSEASYSRRLRNRRNRTAGINKF